jgi:YVTN family beta-propeller protein
LSSRRWCQRLILAENNDFSKVATIPVGKLPHGIWPSGDGTRVYVGLENEDRLTAIDTLANKVIATVPIGQAAQAVNYVPNAVPDGGGMQGLQPLGVAGQAAHLSLVPLQQDTNAKQAPTSVSLFDQGLIQVLQASVTGLQPGKAYVLALSETKNGEGTLESLASFMTNPAGSAIVDAMGPIRQLVQPDSEEQPASEEQRRFLVIAPGTPDQHGAPVQVQAD